MTAVTAPLARFAPRWPIYQTSARIAHRHATSIHAVGVVANENDEPWLPDNWPWSDFK